MNYVTGIGKPLAASLLLIGVHATAQDIEPMQLGHSNRGIWIEIEDEFAGVEPYYNDFAGPGLWMDSAAIEDSGASGAGAQISRIEPDYIGGMLSSEMGSWGGLRQDSGANFFAHFTVERSGRLMAFADFGGHFSNDAGECHGGFMLKKVIENAPDEIVFMWSTIGDANDDAERSYSQETILRPGQYFVYAEVQTNVRGIEIQPDHGRLEFFGAIQLEKLPGCGEPGAGACDQPQVTPSCNDESCCTAVCEIDPFCCDNQWDGLCVDRAATTCSNPPCLGDLNGDGIVNGADQGLLFAAWGAHSPTYIHPADFNQDMVVNGEDLGILMAAWGDC